MKKHQIKGPPHLNESWYSYYMEHILNKEYELFKDSDKIEILFIQEGLEVKKFTLNEIKARVLDEIIQILPSSEDTIMIYKSLSGLKHDKDNHNRVLNFLDFFIENGIDNPYKEKD